MGMYSVTHMGRVESRQAPKRVKSGENGSGSDNWKYKNRTPTNQIKHNANDYMDHQHWIWDVFFDKCLVMYTRIQDIYIYIVL